MDDVIALFHRYKDPVYRLALSFTGSAADAEDVTQTVFLKYLETQPELEVGKEKAWLLQVTANQCRDLWRRLRRRATVPLDEAQAVAVLPPRVEAGGPGRPEAEAHGPGGHISLLLRGVLHRGDRRDAPGEPEHRYLPAPSGPEKAEGTAGTGGIP